jgi:hypothetical protein
LHERQTLKEALFCGRCYVNYFGAMHGRPTPPELRESFIAELESGATVERAAAFSGLPLRTAYNIRKREPEFAEAWESALAVGVWALEREAHRRAVEGVRKPVWYKGRRAIDVDGLPAHVLEYSDTLLILLLKARDPQRYCDRARTAALERKWAVEDQRNRTGATTPAAGVVALLDALAAKLAAVPANDPSVAQPKRAE